MFFAEVVENVDIHSHVLLAVFNHLLAEFIKPAAILCLVITESQAPSLHAVGANELLVEVLPSVIQVSEVRKSQATHDQSVKHRLSVLPIEPTFVSSPGANRHVEPNQVVPNDDIRGLDEFFTFVQFFPTVAPVNPNRALGVELNSSILARHVSSSGVYSRVLDVIQRNDFLCNYTVNPVQVGQRREVLYAVGLDIKDYVTHPQPF